MSHWARLSGLACLVCLACIPLSLWAQDSAAPRIPAPITAAAFPPGGERVVVGSQRGVELWTWPDLKFVRRLPADLSHVHHLQFAPGGGQLYAAGGAPGERGAVARWNWPPSASAAAADLVDVGEEVVYQFALAEPPRLLATAGREAVLWAWPAAAAVAPQPSAASRKLVTLRGHSKLLRAVVALPDGLAVTGGADHSLRVWQLPAGDLVRTLNNHTDQVTDLAVRPGKGPLPMVASASRDGTVRLWQPTIGRMVRFARFTAAPLSIDWTPDGKRLLAGCSDGHLRVIDPETAAVLSDRQVMQGWIYTTRVDPTGRRALVAGARGTLRQVGFAN